MKKTINVDEEKVDQKSAKEIYIEQRKIDGYTVIHKFAGKCTVEEMFARVIKSHT